MKTGIRKLSGPLETRLQQLLFQYRVTPHSTMGASPAECLMGRKLRTHLDRIYPNVNKQHEQKRQHDTHTQPRSFSEEERVHMRNFMPGIRWLPGVIRDVLGSSVMLSEGRSTRRHADHIRRRNVSRESAEPLDFPMMLTTPAVQINLPPQTQPQSTIRQSTRVSHPPDRICETSLS